MGKTEDEILPAAVEQLIRQFQRGDLQQPDEVEQEQVDLTATSTTKSSRRKRRVRQGWDAQFKAMAARGDDRLLDWPDHSLTTWDQEEWVW